jgi:hypothetical protein
VDKECQKRMETGQRAEYVLYVEVNGGNRAARQDWNERTKRGSNHLVEGDVPVRQAGLEGTHQEGVQSCRRG